MGTESLNHLSEVMQLLNDGGFELLAIGGESSLGHACCSKLSPAWHIASSHSQTRPVLQMMGVACPLVGVALL